MNLYVVIGLAIGILLYGALRLGEAVVKFAIRRNQTLILWTNGDAGGYHMERRRLDGNEVTRKDGDEPRRYILDGRARRFGNWGPLYELDSRYGWNLLAPTEAQTVRADKRLQTLSISDPASYHLAIKRNEAQDALTANRGEPDMWVTLAPYLLVGIIILMGGMAFIASRVA